MDHVKLPHEKLFVLPLEAILKNNIALHYFLEYMTSIKAEHYVNLYLNIECESIHESCLHYELDSHVILIHCEPKNKIFPN